jgi:hypothetical protein
VLEGEVVVLGSVLPRVLAQVAHRTPAHEGATARLFLAGEHLHRAGLAGAVAPDHADLVAGAQVERQIEYDDLAPHFDHQVARFQGDHPGGSGLDAAGTSCAHDGLLGVG